MTLIQTQISAASGRPQGHNPSRSRFCGARSKQSGFTLIELLVTLAIVAIVLTIGVPGLAKFVESNRVTSQTNQLIAGLRAARSEAISRNEPVQLDPNGNWTTGFNVKVVSSGNTLRSFDDFGAGLAFDDDNAGSAPTAAELTFQADGSLPSQATIGLELASNCSGDKRRVITVLVSGNTRMTEASC